MPTYYYECECCKHSFEEFLNIDKRDEPLSRKCSNCGAFEKIKRIIRSPRISYEGKYDAFQRAGDGWKEVQQKIKAASGRDNTIRTK
jgi:putative FmdB family regulatory protein